MAPRKSRKDPSTSKTRNTRERTAKIHEIALQHVQPDVLNGISEEAKEAYLRAWRAVIQTEANVTYITACRHIDKILAKATQAEAT